MMYPDKLLQTGIICSNGYIIHISAGFLSWLRVQRQIPAGLTTSPSSPSLDSTPPFLLSIRSDQKIKLDSDVALGGHIVTVPCSMCVRYECLFLHTVFSFSALRPSFA